MVIDLLSVARARLRLFLVAGLALFGMTAAAAESSMNSPINILMDFGAADAVRWYAVNDGVMGGLSQGGPSVVNGQLQFSGTLSMANNGGFSSVRTANRAFNLSDAEALRLRVMGDGRQYQLRLATNARFRGSPVSYGAAFQTVANEWVEVRIALSSLQPSYRGYRLDGPVMDPSDVQEIGLLIGDKLEEPFSLLVDWIAVD